MCCLGSVVTKPLQSLHDGTSNRINLLMLLLETPDKLLLLLHGTSGKQFFSHVLAGNQPCSNGRFGSYSCVRQTKFIWTPSKSAFLFIWLFYFHCSFGNFLSTLPHHSAQGDVVMVLSLYEAVGCFFKEKWGKGVFLATTSAVDYYKFHSRFGSKWPPKNSCSFVSPDWLCVLNFVSHRCISVIRGWFFFNLLFVFSSCLVFTMKNIPCSM